MCFAIRQLDEVNSGSSLKFHTAVHTHFYPFSSTAGAYMLLYLSRIWGYGGGEYEDGRLLGGSAL
jgi:hypothetical protein